MNLKQLTSILRVLIREEVSAAVKEELRPIKKALIESRGSTKNVVSKANTPTKQLLPSSSTKSAPKINIKGPLGDILRDTAASMLKESMSDDNEWPSMGDMRTSADVPEAVMQPSMVSSKPKVMDPANSLLKDYSQLLKKSEAISSQKYS